MATQVMPESRVTDTFPINGTDFVEFWVGNARQAAAYYQHAWGYRLIAYRGPETGTRDRASYVLQQGKIRLVLTTAIRPDGPIAEHVFRHGDGVRDIAFWVDDCRDAFAKAIARGATAVQEPTVLEDDHGKVVIASIRTYGDTIHSIVERKGYRGIFLPGFVPASNTVQSPAVGLQYVDHCVGNVELGRMNQWVAFYREYRLGLPLLREALQAHGRCFSLRLTGCNRYRYRASEKITQCQTQFFRVTIIEQHCVSGIEHKLQLGAIATAQLAVRSNAVHDTFQAKQFQQPMPIIRRQFSQRKLPCGIGSCFERDRRL